MTRRFLLGGAAVLLYAGAAALTARGGAPILPLFDGLAPATQYRWVSPPPDLAVTNEEPQFAEVTIPLGSGAPLAIETGDAQALLTGTADDLDVPAGTEEITIALAPQDPAELGPPPENRGFDSNAYRLDVNLPSGEEASFTGEPTLILRYATHSVSLARWNGRRWQPLESTRLGETLQVWANVPGPGTYVALGPAAPSGGGLGWPIWTAVGVGGAGVVLGFELWLRRARARARKRARSPKGKTRYRR